MKQHTWFLSGVLTAAALAALFLAPARGRDDDKADKDKVMKTAAAKDAVLKLVGALNGKEEDVKKEAADVAMKHDIEFVMNQFKPREHHGLGVGAAPGAAKWDGIETELGSGSVWMKSDQDSWLDWHAIWQWKGA